MADEICEVNYDRRGQPLVTFTLTLPPHRHSAELVTALRRARAEKRSLGHHAAAEAIDSLLALAKWN